MLKRLSPDRSKKYTLHLLSICDDIVDAFKRDDALSLVPFASPSRLVKPFQCPHHPIFHPITTPAFRQRGPSSKQGNQLSILSLHCLAPQTMAPSKAGATVAPFEKEERVLCFHHDMLYEAKILDSRSTENSQSFQYRIHYKGWKNTVSPSF